MIDQIILVAEKIDSSLNLSIDSFDFEKTDTKYFNQVMGSLENIAEKVIHIEDISDLYQYKDSNSIVISLWSGESTKFRKALVPSICESLNIKYLGADPYSSIICQDKNLSKLFARKYGIKSSNGFIVNNIQGLECIPSIQFPVVVKPNFEGGSIGINENSLAPDIDSMKNRVQTLLSTGHTSVLVEEFLPGIEVSIIVCGNKDGISFLDASEIYIKEDPGFLLNNIYSAEKKKIKSEGLTTAHRLATSDLSQSTLLAAEQLFKGLQKCEILRIDGKLNNGEFKLIELTPDIHLGESATFHRTFKLKGYTHKEMMEYIVGLV